MFLNAGHCAKFGSYSVMEARLNKIIDIELVQVEIVFEIHKYQWMNS